MRSAAQPNIIAMIFWRLLVGTVIVLPFGCIGEAEIMNACIGFAIGIAGWWNASSWTMNDELH